MAKKHYQKHTKLYSVWNQMRNRCSNPNDKSYARYGGKGISVCDEWSDFRAFYPWAMEWDEHFGFLVQLLNRKLHYAELGI